MIFVMVGLMVISIAMIIFSLRAIYLAFVKKKDERSKWIVTKSMSEAFVAIVVLQTIPLVIGYVNYSFYQGWWSSFTAAFHVEPVLTSFVALGIALIINTRRHGGSF